MEKILEDRLDSFKNVLKRTFDKFDGISKMSGK